MVNLSGRRPTLTRRLFLASGASAATAPLAGCTSLSEWLGDRFVGDVNLFNLTDARISGSFTLTIQDDALLDETLDLTAESGDEPAAIYEDVWTEKGDYQVTLELDGIPETEPQRLSKTVTVVDPGEEKLVVFIGRELTGQPVTARVIADFAELEEDIEDS